jgi:hypothetical protein
MERGLVDDLVAVASYFLDGSLKPIVVKPAPWNSLPLRYHFAAQDA